MTMQFSLNRSFGDGIARRRRLLLAFAGLGLHGFTTAPDAKPLGQAEDGLPGPLRLPARQTNLATRSVLTRVVRAGQRLVAVGERGIIIWSDTDGKQWRQAQVPVSVTLTAVCFTDARRGWCVGHSGVLLRTDDGGENWTLRGDGATLAKAVLAQAEALPKQAGEAREIRIRQAKRLVGEGADKPLLAICFADAKHGMAVGAYGIALVTSDAGDNWIPCGHRLPNPQNMHLYAVAAAGLHWVVGGEQGVLCRSEDGASTFMAVDAPAKRSFFTACATRDGFVLAGLLDNVCRLDTSTGAIETGVLPAPVSILFAAELADGRLVLLDQRGSLLASNDGGRRFTELLSARRAIVSFVETGDGAMMVVGPAGVARIEVHTQSTGGAK